MNIDLANAIKTGIEATCEQQDNTTCEVLILPFSSSNFVEDYFLSVILKTSILNISKNTQIFLSNCLKGEVGIVIPDVMLVNIIFEVSYNIQLRTGTINLTIS